MEIRQILFVSPGTGEVKAWSSRQLEGEVVVEKRTSSCVVFTLAGKRFFSTKSDFNNRHQGFIYVT